MLRAGFLFWFLVFCALTSGVFFVLALHNEDRQLAWSAVVAFLLLSAAAAAELVWRLP